MRLYGQARRERLTAACRRRDGYARRVSLIVTLQLDRVSQSRFDELRTQYFPPERNLIAAHLTLFHRLPEEPETELTLSRAARARTVFPLEITGVRSLGRGVAYQLRSSVLMSLHAELARAFAAGLIPQDRQRFDPHIVVQNKVEPQVARALLAELAADFRPGTALGSGLDVWRYLGGPWQHVFSFPFSETSVEPSE